MSLSDFKIQRVNANKHTERGIKALDNSITHDGWIGAVTVAADGETFDGSARLEALADAMPSAEPIVIESDGTRPVIVKRTDIPDTDDPRAKRLGVAANVIAHMDYAPDGEILAMIAADDDAVARLIKGDELSADAVAAALADGLLGDADAEPQIDRAAELNEKWQVQRGDLWRIGEHRMLCGDSTSAGDVERVMQGEKAQELLTDPPYNVDYKGNYIQSGKILNESEKIWEEKSFNDKIDNFPAWLNDAYKVLNEFIDKGCAIYIWHPSGAECRHFWSAWLWDDWHFQVDLVWNKQSLIISRWDYKPQHEPCMYGWKGTSRNWIGENNEPTVWDYPRQQGNSGGKREHPTEKPLPIFMRCLQNHNAPIVIEPFAGSGTTLVACQNLQRKCRAIEISPNYCAVILERMATAFPGIEIERVSNGTA